MRTRMPRVTRAAVWLPPLALLHAQVNLGGESHALEPLAAISRHFHVFTQPTLFRSALWLPYRCGACVLGPMGGGPMCTTCSTAGGAPWQGVLSSLCLRSTPSSSQSCESETRCRGQLLWLPHHCLPSCRVRAWQGFGWPNPCHGAVKQHVCAGQFGRGTRSCFPVRRACVRCRNALLMLLYSTPLQA